MAILVEVDHNLCQGHGQCVESAPGVFEVREDGLAYVIGAVTTENLAIVQEAASRCPIDAIRIAVDES